MGSARIIKYITAQIKKVILYSLLSITCYLSSGCSSDFTFSKYPCYLVIDNSIHQDGTLASAMNPMSPGVFCTITADEGKRQYVFSNNFGLSSAKTFTAVDLRLTRDLGMNNALIVGYGTLTGQFMAFDRECPVCFSPDAIPVRSRPVTVDTDGIAHCATCHRRWNLNSGGNYAGEDEETKESVSGIPNLTRYRCSSTGAFGTLAVN